MLAHVFLVVDVILDWASFGIRYVLLVLFVSVCSVVVETNTSSTSGANLPGVPRGLGICVSSFSRGFSLRLFAFNIGYWC